MRNSVIEFASWCEIEQLRTVPDVRKVTVLEHEGQPLTYHTFPAIVMKQKIKNTTAFQTVFEQLGKPDRVAVIEQHPLSVYNRHEICNLSYRILGFDASDRKIPNVSVSVGYNTDPEDFDPKLSNDLELFRRKKQ